VYIFTKISIFPLVLEGMPFEGKKGFTLKKIFPSPEGELKTSSMMKLT